MVTHNTWGDRFPPGPRLVERVEEEIDRAEVLRYLGYPAGVHPGPRVAEAIDFWIAESDRLAAPRAIYHVLPVVDRDRRSLRVESTGGVTEFHGAIGEFLGSVSAVVVFIATAGPLVERRASELLGQNEELGAMVLNAVGAERAEAAEAEVLAQVRGAARPLGLAPTLPYSPGYCGMSLVEQEKLFALLDGGAVGVTLTPQCLMQPIKSISGLIGLGKIGDVDAFRSPCDRCELHQCNMRR